MLDRNQAYIGVLDRRPGDQGGRRTVSHVHQPRRIPAAAAPGQCRPPADAAGARRSAAADATASRTTGAARKRRLPRRWSYWKPRAATDVTLAKLLRRPETTWDDLVEREPALAVFSAEVATQVTYDVKYAGYIARQEVEIERAESPGAKAHSRGVRLRADLASAGRSPRETRPHSPANHGPGQPHQRHHAGGFGAVDDPPGRPLSGRWPSGVSTSRHACITRLPQSRQLSGDKVLVRTSRRHAKAGACDFLCGPMRIAVSCF